MTDTRTRTASTTRASIVVVAILTLAAIFEGLSDNPLHAAFLYAVAFALGWEAFRGRATATGATTAIDEQPGAGRSDRLILLGILVTAWGLGFFGRFSWPSSIAVLIPCAVAMFIAWHRGDAATEPEPVPVRGALTWAALFVALSLFELSNLLLQPSFRTDSHAHPTMSVLMDPVLATHSGRTITLALWLAAGWYLQER